MTLNPKKIALISVSDKTGVLELADVLSRAGYEIVSTGGTAKALQEAEIPCKEVKDLTDFPEILGGRVKTLHPKIFGGILYSRENSQHKSDVDQHHIPSIDIVVVNLYPFQKIHLENKIPKYEMLEFIDIGGVSLLRAAAKNFLNVTVLCDPKDYTRIGQDLNKNLTPSIGTRMELAAKAFAHTAHYDSMIAKYFRETPETEFKNVAPSKTESKEIVSRTLFPEEITIGLQKVCDLRYGENPHQKASLYKESGGREWGVVHAEKLQGKELSFNNYLDLEQAWQIASSFPNQTACVIIKHTNPCGVAIGQTALESYQSAFHADPTSAFGGIVGFSTVVDEETAKLMTSHFFECVIAPDYSQAALDLFKKKSNLRVLRQKTTLSLPYEFDTKKISGGILLQEMDRLQVDVNQISKDALKVVTKRAPAVQELFSLELAWKVCKYVKSNAIVLARGTVTEGIGAGQTSRIDSLKIAIQKAGLLTPESFASQPTRLSLKTPISASQLPLVMASDGFFPFRDCVDQSAEIGVSAIIQPGGSIRDQESIDAANEHNIAMLLTGVRHFRH